jgi:hypothetical protein
MAAAVLSNIFVFLVLAVGATLATVDADLYYSVGQEDGFLEWATFWAFVIAGYRYSVNAFRHRRASGGIPWFAAGLGLFCILVALEEISWGQRLVGYQPPDYFLQENYQQEFNLHNVFSTSLRKLTLLVILAGYGVGTAVVSLIPAVGRTFRRWYIVPAPAALIPAFLAMSVLYAWYPWDYTGEWVELAMGLGFLCAAFLVVPPNADGQVALHIVRAAIATAALALLTIFVQGLARPNDERADEMARAEIKALVNDFSGPKLHTRCGIHKRLYTFMRDYGQTHLLYGEFAKLLRDNGEYTRANYLLDPWNSPYWLRHRCSGGRVAIFVYSFGPNRQRDSSEWEILGDDVGMALESAR